MTSKRRYHRVRPKGVTAQIETGAGITTYAVGDLSMGGLYLHTPEEEFPAGSRLLLTLVKPGLKRGLQLGAVVAFTRPARGTYPPGVGLRFDELGAADRERLQQILRELGLDSPDAPDTGEPPIDWGDAVSMSAPRKSPAPPADYGKEPPTEPNIKVPKGLGKERSSGLSTLFDDFKPPPPEKASEPIPFSSAHAGFRPPPKPIPLAKPQEPIALPAPSSPAASIPEPDPATANLDPQERLMVQIRGLLLQLGEAQERLAARENEIAALKEEVQRLTRQLEEADPERARRR